MEQGEEQNIKRNIKTKPTNKFYPRKKYKRFRGFGHACRMSNARLTNKRGRP